MKDRALKSSGRARVALRPRPVLRRLAALSLVFLAVACAGQDTREAERGYDTSRASHLFAVGFQDVSDIYISDVAVEDLAFAGLESLSTLDPEIVVRRGEGQISLLFKSEPAANFPAPARRDSDGWGSLTAAAIEFGRGRSLVLGAAGPEGLYEAVFDGVTTQLDGFSRYAGEEEARDHRASRDGFGGIGVRIGLVDEGVKIMSVMENTPAEDAGLLDGDIITAIDGEAAVGLSQRDVVRRLRGPLQSSVELVVLRQHLLTADQDSATAPEPRRLTVDVTRAHIVPQTIKYRAEGNVAYLQVTGFNQSTARTLRKKIELAQRDLGSRLAGFVIDLRNNPGGLLDQAVAVSDLFLPAGRIVSTHGRHPDSHQYFDAAPDDLTTGRPVVVLVNGNSASAAEIVAAALQDLGRAVLIGSNSFGKGTVQTVLRLPNEGELTLTWARFHAPSGYALNRRGVIPDICTSGDVTTAQDALDRLRRGLFPIDRALRTSEIDPANDDELNALRAHCPLREGENGIDLQVALDLLSNPALYARALGGVPNTAEAPADRVSATAAALAVPR